MKHHPIIAHRALGFRGRQVMALVRETIAIDGVAPSYGMIQRSLGFKTRSDVHCVVVRLEKRALLSRAGSGRVRRIRLG